MSYTVYRVSYAGLPRDHHAIFVEMNNDQSGHLFQVTGDIQNGMKHNDKPAKKPEESGTYQSKEFIGRVAAADFARILPTCESIPPPKKQFEGARRLYPKEPLRRCQEWTQEAVNALVNAGILKK
ncbi:uncharacterized protein N7506_003196 [Penicillium brevicompactum]|uniref:uncharacterized protein n=1 Tax=Penicillium brevicompactum TaxID=5074 RepID=UPI00253FA92A|nr:uncharacterized protein N7506_003196 [Penicillium brevicompactum]KAJ5343372.1 hypothetical protein N7506_003196 [Penicillium brevicompactum]